MHFALITILALKGITEAAEIGPHLLDTNQPTLHPDVATHETVSIEDLLTPFAGQKTGLAFRVHADNDAKTTDGGVADAIVAALRQSGLPADPAEAAAVLTKSPVPLSITLQFEYLDEAAWPVGVKNLAEAFGETNGRAEVEGGLLLHAYLSTAGAAALPSHEDLGDILVVQLAGAKTWTFDADDYVVMLEPGDGLVIPADTRHAARATEGGVSAHLTIHRIAEHQTDIARRQLRLDDEDPNRCYSGDAYCPSACEGDCDDCVYCTDADTICRSEVEKNPFYDGYPYNICCLTIGYEIERAEPCECPRWPGPDPECSPTYQPTKKPTSPGGYAPTYKPTRKPSGSGGCEDDESWKYDAGEKGEKGCDHVASEPDKVEKRCSQRVSDDGVPAYEACQLTCGSCSFSLHDGDMTYKKCKKACEKKGLRLPCITSKAVDEALERAIKLERDYSGWIAYNDKEEEGEFVWEDGCTSSYTNWDAGPPQEPNDDPNFGGEDCTIKWNDGTVWNDVPCDYTYPCYCQAVKGGGTR